jgi:MFS family permease
MTARSEETARSDPPASPSQSSVVRTVYLMGTVSLLTDISSESVAAVLPLYITAVLGLSPLAFGVVDSLFVGVSAVMRIVAGWVADRTDRPKWVAFSGYALSAVSRIALLPAAGLASLSAVVTVDRLGKGIRTAPRDAIIAASSSPRHLGRSFGVHRAMDTFGAMTGPLMACLVLMFVPEGYDVVFVLSLAVALVGLAVLGLLVPDVRTRPVAEVDSCSPSGRCIGSCLVSTLTTAATGSRPAVAVGERTSASDLFGRVSPTTLLEPGFVRLLAAAGLLGLVTVSDSFLYLVLQRRDGFASEWFPLLYVGTAVSYLLLAIPLGRAADRFGRGRIFIAGHTVLVLAYLCVGGPVSGPAMTVIALLLMGAYYAATDGVLAAVAGAMVPITLRASGIATAQTVVVVGRALSSLGFGMLWTTTGRDTAVLVYAVAMAVAIPAAGILLRGVTRDRSPAGRPRSTT